MFTFPGTQGDVLIDGVGVATVGAHFADGAATLSVMTAISTSWDLISRANLTGRPPRHACATTPTGMQIDPPRRNASSNRACIRSADAGWSRAIRAQVSNVSPVVRQVLLTLPAGCGGSTTS